VTPTRKVFISYSRQDSLFAEDLSKRLKKDGIAVWFDSWEINVGDSIVRRVQEGIMDSDFLVILLSPNAVGSKWVDQELNAATIKNIESEGVFVLPVLIKECQIPLFLSDRKYADFTKDPTAGYQSLLSVIQHGCEVENRAHQPFQGSRLSIVHISSSVFKRFFFSPGLPLRKFTIANRSGSTQIITQLECDVLKYYASHGIIRSRVLLPLAIWDVCLPFREKTVKYDPSEPILIANNDAVAITVRFYCESAVNGKPLSPSKCGHYEIQVRFLSDQGLMATSDIFSL